MNKKGNFRIKKLTEEWIEQVRFWRNQSFVRQQMEYNAVITESSQKKWFKSIQSDYSQQYFIFFSGNIPVGVIHLSKINLEEKVADVGLFIGDAHFIGTGISLEASLFILELAFVQLKLEKLTAKVKNDNLAAIRYNELLGFRIQHPVNQSFSQYLLEKENYFQRLVLFKKLLT
jgi:UDP-4-amino-4,6-dideoxy-N-acetyl-beta-L-altrosamine N-acetyltransferase